MPTDFHAYLQTSEHGRALASRLGWRRSVPGASLCTDLLIGGAGLSSVVGLLTLDNGNALAAAAYTVSLVGAGVWGAIRSYLFRAPPLIDPPRDFPLRRPDRFYEEEFLQFLRERIHTEIEAIKSPELHRLGRRPAPRLTRRQRARLRDLQEASYLIEELLHGGYRL